MFTIQDSDEYSEWSKLEYTKNNFASQLLRFSINELIENLQKTYNEFSFSNKNEKEFKEPVLGVEFEINKFLASVIYQVLVIIVPY